jgi:cAMP phosphodiesterase
MKRIARYHTEYQHGIRYLVCECGYRHQYPRRGVFGHISPLAMLGQLNNIKSHHEEYSKNHLGLPLPAGFGKPK